MKKFGDIQACFGPTDPLTNFCGIMVNPSSVCSCFGHMNPLTSFGGIVVKPKGGGGLISRKP